MRYKFCDLVVPLAILALAAGPLQGGWAFSEVLSLWLKTKLAIRIQKNKWDSNIEELEKLVEESGKPNALDTYKES